jgi:hypothetical protein
MKLVIMSIVLLFIITMHRNEGYINEGYINNSIPPDKPDITQYYACHDYSSNSNLGNNNYKEIKHGIDVHLKGPYTDFLDIYGIRNYDELFHAPVCDKHYSFEHISSLEPPTEIIDHTNIPQQEELVKQEIEFDKNAVKDPFYFYGNPKFIENKLIHSDDINQLFLRNHTSHDEGTLLHRLDNDTLQ